MEQRVCHEKVGKYAFSANLHFSGVILACCHVMDWIELIDFGLCYGNSKFS